MKRTKLMLGVAAISAALLGTGYAALTDSLLIQGRVTTADLCVQFEDEGTIEVSDQEVTLAAPELDQENHRMSFVVSNLYEGATATYKTTVKNEGTLSAALAGVRIASNVAEGDDESLTEKINVVFKMGTPDNLLVYEGTLSHWDKIPVERIKNIVLASGENVPVELTVSLAKGAQDQTKHTEPQTIGFNLDIDWAQKTNQ